MDRTQISVRLSDAGLAAVDAYALTEERSRSDMLRKLLSEAIAQRRMQEGHHDSAS